MPVGGPCSSGASSSHIQEGVQVLSEIDFLARVEAAERRDNMQANPDADPALKYAAIPNAFPGCAASPAAAMAKAEGSKQPRIQRTSPLREHRVHDETGGAQPQRTQARKLKQPSLRMPSGRPPASGRTGSKSTVTPRPAGGAPLGKRPIVTQVGGRLITTPRPPGYSLGAVAHGRLGPAINSHAALPTSARLPPRMAVAPSPAAIGGLFAPSAAPGAASSRGNGASSRGPGAPHRGAAAPNRGALARDERERHCS